MTKQVEEDKRSQRKRTADELLDEELDKGKVSFNLNNTRNDYYYNTSIY